MSVVRTAYGPTLPQLLGPRRWRMARAIAIAFGLALLAIAIADRASSSERTIASGGTPAFNYAYAPPLRPLGATGVQERRGELFVQSMTVTTLRLPRYRGDLGGTLPILADRLAAQLAAEHADFRTVDEGRARINDNLGYYVGWEAMRDGRKLFGRDYMLAPGETASPRLGVRLQLLSTYAGGVASSADVGRTGKLKQALRSFRFGTERP